MSVEMKVGFWWTRGGELACVLERNSISNCPLKGYVAGLGAASWSDDGVQWGGEDDLVKYIGLTHPGVTVRPKPEPKWVPWSFEDQIVGMPVKFAEERRKLITEQTSTTVFLGGAGVSYENLLKHYVQLDGTPCGKQVTE